MSERVYFISLGCAKNRVDSEVMLGQLQAQGYRITETPEEAAVIIVNTCSFIRSAVEESIETILEAARFKERGLCRVLGVTGCFPQRYREELVGRLPEVDFFLGTESFWGIARHVREALTRAGGTTLDLKPDPALWHEPWERLLTTPPGTAYLKIAEGCSNRCAYCTIPDIRGPFRSRDPKILVAGGRVPGGPGGQGIDPGGPGHHGLRGRSFPACFPDRVNNFPGRDRPDPLDPAFIPETGARDPATTGNPGLGGKGLSLSGYPHPARQ